MASPQNTLVKKDKGARLLSASFNTAADMLGFYIGAGVGFAGSAAMNVVNVAAGGDFSLPLVTNTITVGTAMGGAAGYVYIAPAIKKLSIFKRL